ncbi:ATP phosphoribosyltransferase regulatory subunit [Mariprofundus sp. EBB-1]|uniref:ATP phosphoribosyltransferase regulatory subunit n=1 Tax=Mariprofundus sp. EBB-1 TaxID=2650971 RepID=UPI000EF25A04|nr:ATP phosphoribosyltransferase regulatory subunit [Mariprofundus sp. EBB-1]RLL55944.1 ATP phosphoribosyltransferase regulatory subunit [Mariprofundus sp. EBB-1]
MPTHKPIIGLNDAFGSQAKALRSLQGRILNLFDDAGYEEVIPPMLERPDSMNSGAGRFLADQTVVFSDPAGAGSLAIRSDMTPQIARIAATRLQHEKELKLCYSGTVMLARPDVRGGSRQQWQTGVECLGIKGSAGDIEVMHLAARTMLAAGFNKPVLQVGHIGLLKALVNCSTHALDVWTKRISRRSPDDLIELLATESLPEASAKALVEMVSGVADQQWLKANIGCINDDFDAAANELLALVDEVGDKMEGHVSVHADAAVMPRFLYHSGILFAGYAEGVAHAVLHGGRYDAMMSAHGRDMAATGFSCDLWTLINAG